VEKNIFNGKWEWKQYVLGQLILGVYLLQYYNNPGEKAR